MEELPAFCTGSYPLLRCTAFAAGFSLLALALGRRVFAWCGARSAGNAEYAVVGFVTGAGLLQFVPFVLALAGVLSPGSLAVAVVSIALLLARDIAAVAGGVAHAGRPLAAIARTSDGWTKLWLLALLPALGVALLIALAPVLDPDGLSYHLTVPKRWLMRGSFAYLPTYPYSNTPMGVEMLFTLGLGFAGDSGAKLVHLMLACAGGVATYFSAARIRGSVTGLVAVSIYFVGPAGVAAWMGAGYVEGAAAGALATALLAWLLWYEEGDLAALRMAALLCGVGTSFKLTMALFPIALAAATVLAWFTSTRRETARPGGAHVAGLVCLMAAPPAPWLARSAWLTGNPVFPMFASVIPSRDLTAEQSRQFTTFIRYMIWASAHARTWTLGQRKLILFSFCALVVLVAVLVATRAKGRFTRGLIAIVAGFVLFQAFGVGLYMRYWIPIVAVLQIPVLAGIDVGRWLRAPLARAVLVAGTLAGSALQMKQALSLSPIRYRVLPLLKAAVTLDGRRDLVLAHATLYSMYAYANKHLPKDAGILLSTYCGGFYIDRTTYCTEFVQSALRFDSWEHFLEDVRRLGINYVMGPRILAEGGSPPTDLPDTSSLVRAQEFAVVGRLLREHGHLLAEAGDQGLYGVNPPAPPE